MHRTTIATTMALGLWGVVLVAEASAQAGLVGRPTDLAPMTIASGEPIADGPYELEAGRIYRLPIRADGSAEMAIEGAEFFRNVWVNEVVIDDIEVRPLGIDSIEFDDEGEARLSFVPIRAGTYELKIRGTDSDMMRVEFVVR